MKEKNEKILAEKELV